ncbi:DUF2752 domain-containing protein [Streptomyces sp. NPDC015127]|uniref:DUF2752 domain-containing protein n=1 Tax=Streptomyces sp. NPDC015127 TaxID=3364939 RepID=UPI00370114B7
MTAPHHPSPRTPAPASTPGAAAQEPATPPRAAAAAPGTPPGPAASATHGRATVSGDWAGSAAAQWGPGAVPVSGRPAPRGTARRVAVPLAVLSGVVAAFAYVGAVDPNEPGHYPVCPLLRFTGIYCPGCGGLRSAHAFVHGDLATALGANAAAVVGYAVFAAVWAVWLVRAVRGRPMRVGLAPGWWWVMGGALLIFSVVRNLPFGSALAP